MINEETTMYTLCFTYVINPLHNTQYASADQAIAEAKRCGFDATIFCTTPAGTAVYATFSSISGLRIR